MAKKELNFGKLGLPQKATIIKKDEQTPNIEQAIEKIHGETPKSRVGEAPAPTIEVPKVEPVEMPEPTPKTVATEKAAKAKTVERVVEHIELEETMPVKKISMDLPLDVYKYLKINSFEKAITMKDYVLRLIEADMKKK